MDRRLDAEVLVVGGGPAGAATAALLAGAGRDVLVLEKARLPREKACAEFMSPGVVAALGRLGALEAVRASGPAWPAGMKVITPRRGFLVSYAGEPGGSALGIARPIFDRILLDHASARGARVLEGQRATGAILEGGRVVGARVRGAAGERAVRAGMVVAADGLRSAVARSLGLERWAPWPRRLGLVARYEGVGGIERYGEMHVGRGVYCGLAPVGGGQVNAGLVTLLGETRAGESVEAYFERRLAEVPGAARALAGGRRVTAVRGAGPLARRVARTAGPGYALVGDAAGFFDPFTGEGVYRALRGAELAADAIDDALRRRGGFDATAAAGYQRARRAEFAAKEWVCALVQVFLSSPTAFDYVAGRLAARGSVALTLSGVLGDIAPAAPALRPAFLWSLLRP